MITPDALPITFGGGPISFEVPADHRALASIRQWAWALAESVGCDDAACDDIRITVDECCAWLMEFGDGSALVIEARQYDGILEITGTANRRAEIEWPRSSTDDVEFGNLVSKVLGSVSGDHRLELDSSFVRFWSRSEAS